MGCFDVVCALTNVPIHTGEKCHLVICRAKESWDSIVWLNSDAGRFSVEEVFHGEYDDYGSIDPEGEITESQAASLQAFDDERHDRKHFFVCDTAWRWAQERFKDYTPYYITERREMRAAFTENHPNMAAFPFISDPTPEKEAEQIALGRVLAAFSRACKHPLSGLGQYHQYDGTESESIRENLALIEKRLQEVERRRAEWDEENKADEEGNQ